MDHCITALRLQKHNRQRVNIYLDGEYAFALAHILAAWLQVGQTLNDEKITQLKSEDGQEAAYQRALRLLERRPHTRAEICQNLQKHGIAEDIITYVLERLQTNGLLNDVLFAQTWVEQRRAFHPRSRRALAFELRQRGITPQVIEESLEDTNDEEAAYLVARKQSRRYQALEWTEFRQRMYAFLVRRGFRYEVCAPVIQRVWEEHTQPDQGNKD